MGLGQQDSTADSKPLPVDNRAHDAVNQWFQTLRSVEKTDAIEPTHHFTIEGIDDPYSLVFLPEQNSVLVHTHAPALSYWRLGVTYWPEMVAIIAGLIALVCLWRVVRTLRRPRTNGEPYCKKCNYHLATLAVDAKCPECGRMIANVQISGRRLHRRLAVPMTVFLAGAVAAFVVLVAPMPRTNAMKDWWYIDASRLHEWATDNEVEWILKAETTGDVIFEVDLATGDVVRTVYAHAGMTFWDMSHTPDRSAVILCPGAGGSRGEMAAIDVRTGRRRGAIRVPGEGSFIDMSYRDRGAVRPWVEPAQVLVAFVDKPAGESVIAAWDIDSGSLETVARLPVYYRDQRMHPPVFHLGADGTGCGFFALPNFMEAMDNDEYVIQRLAPSGELLAIDVHGIDDFDRQGTAAFDQTRHRLYIPELYGSRIREVDLPSGDVEKFGMWFPIFSSIEDMLICRNDRYLIAAGTNGVWIADLQQPLTGVRLTYPTRLFAPRLSEGGGWVGAICQAPSNQSKQYPHEIVLWDLSDVLDAPGD